MNWILSILFSIVAIFVQGQTKIYVGPQKITSDLIYEIENKIVYRVNNLASKTDFLYIDGDKIYFKDRKYFTDVKYTIQNNCFYKGSSTFDKLFTFKDDKLYLGEGNFQSDCLFTFKNGVVYRGDSESTFDAFMSYEVQIPSELIYVVMLTLPY